MSISQSASPTAESETCAICSTVPDAADRRMVCAQCVDAFFAGSKPASESAEELRAAFFQAMAENRLTDSEMLRLISAHDAEVLRQAAERARSSHRQFPHYYHQTSELNTADAAILVADAVAAILGEALDGFLPCSINRTRTANGGKA